jgi:hypothetical protein
MRKLLIYGSIVLLLAACAGGSQMQRERQQAMDLWRDLVRWSEYDGLVDMIHPAWLAANPVRNIELERLRQYRVSEYRARQIDISADGKQVERLARIRLYHLHSARERVIRHREVWRYDASRERWLLHSGLPDPSGD